MEIAALARWLIEADPAAHRDRLRVFLATGAAPALALAAALKQCYDDVYTTNLAHAAAAAHALDALASLVDDAAIGGYAAWTAGLVAMDEGRLDDAVVRLDAAEQLFSRTGDAGNTAAVQIGKMPALAMQGRFEEALDAGLTARIHCEATGDLLTTGKIEQNLGNLEFVRHRYRAAEAFYRTARTRFTHLGDQRQLAQIDNCLATTLTSQHRFTEAEARYAEALQRAEDANLDVTLAEIECNVGCLALYQGRYDRALDYLERSRRRYAQLGMPHELAIADQELADAYLELNMAAEAAAIYARIAPIFADLGMPIERARALAYHGRACIQLGEPAVAHQLLEEARRLYAQAEAPVGEAITQLTHAQLDIQAGDLSAADALLAEATLVFVAAHAEGWRLQAEWLRGVVARRQGRLADAQSILTATLQDAARNLVTQMVQRCATELGLVALAGGDARMAEAYFRQAVDLVESMRAPLPAEEFRMGFVGDKLTPYAELVRLCLADGAPERLAAAFGYVERSRARALVDLLGAAEPLNAPRDDFEIDLMAQLDRLRGELNWFYSQLNRPDGASAARGGAEAADIQDAARDHEAEIQTILRQLQQRNVGAAPQENEFDLAELQRKLGDDTALIEYFAVDDGLLAFVVTGAGLDVFDLNCTEAEIMAALQQFRFQLGALRLAGAHIQRHMPALLQRVRRPLARLHTLLLAPLLPRVGDRRLVIAPYQSQHYVPFHALYDGRRFVVETREVSVTPSASLLLRCLAAPVISPNYALLIGQADDFAPRVADEVATIAPLFARSTTLVGDDATRSQLQHHAPSADLLHIACHGRFRSDNPFFSALHLADGWMIVRDAYELRLRCMLVTLSACETGVSALAPGNDLVGLARGFLLAGAPALLVSLWMVDDAATADLMTSFYRALLTGIRPAAALRRAQCELLATHPHPFFWAPFTLIGRW